jgi:streptomycin 6-kinase
VPRPIDVSPLARQRAESYGEAGRRWLTELPDVVDALVDQWGLSLGARFDGGTAAYVAAATDVDGRECVLKVAMLLDDEDRIAFDRSVLVHGLADGRGCAALIAHDADAPAMLLERLGPNLHDLGMAVPDILDAVADTLGTFWRPVPDGIDLPTGADKAQWLAGFIVSTWETLDRPVERRVIDRAVGLCDARAQAYDAGVAVLVHGDAHGWNTVAAGRGGGTFKLVDPEGVRSSPEHDLAVPMREYNEPLLDGDTARLVRARAEHLAARCDVDADAVWEWGFIERVSTGLVALAHFTDGSGGPFLEVARRCT